MLKQVSLLRSTTIPSNFFFYSPTTISRSYAAKKAAAPVETAAPVPVAKPSYQSKAGRKILMEEDDENLKKKFETETDFGFLLGAFPQFRHILTPVIRKSTIEKLLDFHKSNTTPIKPFHLVDVRDGPTDYIIPQSINIPMPDLEIVASRCYSISYGGNAGDIAEVLQMLRLTKQEQIPLVDHNIIVFGTDSNETEVACQMLKRAGFKNLFNYRGGIADWFGLNFAEIFNKELLEYRTLRMNPRLPKPRKLDAAFENISRETVQAFTTLVQTQFRDDEF